MCDGRVPSTKTASYSYGTTFKSTLDRSYESKFGNDGIYNRHYVNCLLIIIEIFCDYVIYYKQVDHYLL
jgi:hypothetical protein